MSILNLFDKEHADNAQTSWETPRHSIQSEVSSLSKQEEKPNSLFNFYKKWIHLRRQHPILNLGTITPYEEHKQAGLIAFFREYQGEKWWVIHNLGGRRKKIKPPQGFSHMQFFTRMPEMLEDKTLELASFSSVILSEEK